MSSPQRDPLDALDYQGEPSSPELSGCSTPTLGSSPHQAMEVDEVRPEEPPALESIPPTAASTPKQLEVSTKITFVDSIRQFC